MRLHFYNQLLYERRLTDLASLPQEERERITQYNRYLERYLGPLQCRLYPLLVSRVLPEWKKGRISFSLFTCCIVHAFDVHTTMRRLSLRGECLAGTRIGSEEGSIPAAPPRIGFSLFKTLRTLQIMYHRNFNRQPLLKPR